MTLNAQNKITGKITDQNNLPVPGAVIFIQDILKGAMADENGKYELKGLPNGKIKIQYSFIGYKNKIETVLLDGKNIELNIQLEPSLIEIDEVIVSGGYNSTQHENAVKIDVLKVDQLYNKNTSGFAEVLTKIPGVSMISKGSGISKPVIRGLSMNDILILNNGVRYENYQYSDHHPLGIDEFGIENVEIIKGPASLLYGSDAIGGAINFIKEKPAQTGTIEGDYNLKLFSNSLGMTNNLGIKGAQGKFFGGIRVGQKTDADYLQGGGAFVPNSRFNELAFKANTGYSGKNGTFNLFYDYNDAKLGLTEPEAIKSVETRGYNINSYHQQFTTNLISSQNRISAGKFRININSAFQNTELAHFAQDNIYEIQMKLATLTYETRIYLPSDAESEYIISFQGMNQKNTNINNRDTKLLPDAQTNNYSASGLFQHTFFHKLNFQTGIRYDNKSISSLTIGSPSDPGYHAPIDKSYGSFSGSFGTTYNLTKKLLFRANFASAYRTPNLAELTSNGPHELRYEIGNSNLKPENSFEADISVHFHGDNLTFDLAAFQNNIKNYIFISPTADTASSGLRIYRYLQNQALLTGMEAGLHVHPKNIEWLHFETTFSSVTGLQKNGNYLPFIPADKLNFEIRAENKKLFLFREAFISVNSETSFAQNHPAPDETPDTGYTLFDLTIGGKIHLKYQPVSISLGANNLLDTKYIDHLSTLKEVNMLNPGRNFTLYIKVPFTSGKQTGK